MCLHAVISNCLYLGTISHHSGGNIKGFSCFISYFQHPGHQNYLVLKMLRSMMCAYFQYLSSHQIKSFDQCEQEMKKKTVLEIDISRFFWRFHVSSRHCNVLNGFPSCVNTGFLMKYRDGCFHV